MRCCSTRAQVRHAAPVMFPLNFDDGEHVYRVQPINVQLVTDPVIMPAMPRDILLCHVERRDQSSAVAERTER